jgi:hypothetical protein
MSGSRTAIMHRYSRLVFAGLAGAILALGGAPAAGSPNPAPALPQSAGDRGITDTQWRTLPPPELRRLAGFPGSASAVLAAAQNGDPRAMALISGAYATGSGVPQNDSEAFRWAERSAATGLPFGIHVLSLDYFYGTGVPANPAQYLRLLRQAADAGSILAAGEYAKALFRGELVAKDFAGALRYARIGAEGGISESKMLYGTLLYDRSLPGRDPTEAGKWVRAAASEGYDFARKAAAALDAQDGFSASAKNLFVSSFGNSLVGAHTVVAAPDDPCVTQIVVDLNGTTGSFLINWQETMVASAGNSFLNLSGAILNGTERAGGDIRRSLGLSLHRDQSDVPEEQDRMFELASWARRVSDICHAL